LWEDRITRQEVLETQVPTRQVVVIGKHRYMILNTNVRRKRIRVILDSSTQGNFILLETVGQLNMLIREKEKPYLFNIIDRIVIKQDKGIVRHEIIPMQVKIRRYIEEIGLDIIKINNHQIIFGVP
jgi:hypothetical protein